MKVSIKDFTIDMDVKTNGVEFEIRDNQNKFLGDCYVTKTGVTICPGKTSKANGKKITWKKLFEMADQ